MKHGHFLAFFSIVRVLFRQWGDFLDFGEGIVRAKREISRAMVEIPRSARNDTGIKCKPINPHSASGSEHNAARAIGRKTTSRARSDARK